MNAKRATQGIQVTEEYRSTLMDFVNIFADLTKTTFSVLVIVGKEPNTKLALTVHSVNQVNGLIKSRNKIIYMF